MKFFFQYDLICDGIWDYQDDYYQKLDKNKNYYEISGNLIELYVFGIALFAVEINEDKFPKLFPSESIMFEFPDIPVGKLTGVLVIPCA